MPSLTVQKNIKATQKSKNKIWFFCISAETENWARGQLCLPSHKKPTHEVVGSSWLSTPSCETGGRPLGLAAAQGPAGCGAQCSRHAHNNACFTLPVHTAAAVSEPRRSRTYDKNGSERGPPTLPRGASCPGSCPSGSAAHRLVRKTQSLMLLLESFVEEGHSDKYKQPSQNHRGNGYDNQISHILK